MSPKNYPKAVVLKKSLVGIAIFGTALIMMLILHNLYNAAHAQNLTKAADTANVQDIANQADTNWYQHQTINKPANSQYQLLSVNHTTANHLQTPSTRDNKALRQSQQDVLKAMGAPINSNQLTAENQNGSSISSGNPLTVPSGLNTSDTDPNMQSEKQSFIQQNNQSDDDYLSSTLQNPISPYELQAGTIIPGILITGINSDLPGQITGQVRSNVYDSISGNYCLIPQGAKLIGIYDSQVAYGQERVLVVWKRIIFPNGQSMDLQGMPGVDMSGYAGFYDQVNNHYGKIFGSVILMSVLGAGAQLAQPQNNTNPFAAPTVGQTLAQSLGTNLANTGTMITGKNINIQPTLQIRPGYEFNISVTKDMVFPTSYSSN